MSRIDEIVAHGMGKVKAVKARLEGLVGVFNTLAEQHGEVAAMFKRVQGNPEKRAELWPLIRKELISHEHSEVRELYPVLRQYEQTRALADWHDAEARELDAMIARLDMLDPCSEAWTERFDELVNMVLYHATEEEEQKIFPIAQETIGEARAKDLDAKVLAARQRIMDQL